jgi:hypothetical protein
MNLELNNQQTDWLAKTEELNDTEASQVNGGAVANSAAEQREEELRQQDEQNKQKEQQLIQQDNARQDALHF